MDFLSGWLVISLFDLRHNILLTFFTIRDMYVCESVKIDVLVYCVRHVLSVIILCMIKVVTRYLFLFFHEYLNIRGDRRDLR